VTDDRQDAARRWLTQSLSDAMGSTPLVVVAAEGAFARGFEHDELHGEDDDDEPWGEGAIEAYRALDVLPGDELDRWRDRFRVARGARGAAPPRAEPERIAAAERHLDRLLREIEAIDDAGERAAGHARFDGAFSLLLRAGLVDRHSMTTWGERLDSVAPMIEHVGAEPIGAGGGDAYSPEELAEIARGPGDARAVIALQPLRHDGVCVTCVEIHERAVSIHWHAVGGPMPPEMSFTVEDDAGTRYGAPLGGGSTSAGDEVVHGESRVAGVPPPHARRLVVRSDAGEWVVELPAAG
jgi:hypothetical protein